MNYLFQISPEYLDSLEKQYREAPESLPAAWRFFFDGVETAKGSLSSGPGNDFEMGALNLIEAYRNRGHWVADIDPIGRPRRSPPPRLDLSHFGLHDVPRDLVLNAGLHAHSQAQNLEKLVEHLRATYCGPIGVEYSHLSDENARLWLAQKMEACQNRPTLGPADREEVLGDLVKATHFENFIHKNYTGQKRFSLEGGESIIPALNNSIRKAAALGIQNVVIGMAHRGRLNVLTNVLHKPFEKVFAEFEGLYTYEDGERAGDVKYHMGYSKDLSFEGKNIHLSLMFNPSHLETVNAIALGSARARQDSGSSTLPILVHGDAAVIGQGVVHETLNLWNLEGYKTGGTIHIVINNQVGFTTDPEDSRSGFYCTDFAKAIEAPIFHVNGNNPEAVVHALNLSLEYRNKFGKDAFVDLVCFRKYGHNEGDEPRFTQPEMYGLLGKTKNPLESYVERNQTPKDNLESLISKFNDELSKAKEKVHKKPITIKPDWFQKQWEGFSTASESDMLKQFDTSVPDEVLQKLIETTHSWPKGFEPLPKLAKVLESRRDELKKTTKADWAVGEQLAFGSILLQGYSIRLTGQDAQRGTFSHRHVVLTDHKTQSKYSPLQQLAQSNKDTPVRFDVFNSPLSEYAVMGYDLGYSLTNPRTLAMWEAQFGDFANGAQIIIDQYLASSEAKWHRTSGLVLLLPHGFEGQGPEHSSARLERYLQLCARGNIQVAYPTTPAQMFHLLRRQVLRNFRKPLIIMTPKSPLRMPEVTSELKEFTSGGFKNLIIEAPENPKRVIFCSGKVIWDLKKAATQNGLDKETAFVRIEQLYPLDKALLKDLLTKFKSAKDWVWAQEEPENNGAWGYFRLATLELGLPLRYAGRAAAPSVATGSPRIHQEEQELLLKTAFQL